jgi:hypothetical protein
LKTLGKFAWPRNSNMRRSSRGGRPWSRECAPLISLPGMKRCLLSVHIREQLLEPVFCKLIGDVLRYAPVVRDLLVEFVAFVAHGSPPNIQGREQTCSQSSISAEGRAMMGLTLSPMPGSRQSKKSLAFPLFGWLQLGGLADRREPRTLLPNQFSHCLSSNF